MSEYDKKSNAPCGLNEKFDASCSPYVICKSVLPGIEHRPIGRLPRRDHESPPFSLDDALCSQEEQGE